MALEYSRIKVKKMKRSQQGNRGSAADALPGESLVVCEIQELKTFKQQRVISRLNAAGE